MALPLFAATLFVSAFVLFLVQPMVGKLILPKLGGTPQVWNTCMVFFQTALLAGYAYTHTSTTRFTLRRQLTVHCVLLFLPLIVLLVQGPFYFANWTPPLGSNPILSTLAVLTFKVGIPFFVVATSAPLLQRWFVATGHPAARDPYFLYGASNLGSLLALLAYPALVEPFLGLQYQQPWFWTALYVVLAGLALACAAMVWKAPPLMEMPLEPAPAEIPVPPVTAAEATAVKAAPASGVSRKKFGKAGKLGGHAPTTAPTPAARTAEGPRSDAMTPWRRIRWVLLAAAPSSLMLGVTTYICTDLSPIPLLWVVPLALYLLTFILVFMRWPVLWVDVPHKVTLFLQPVLVLALCVVIINRGFSPVWHTLIAMAAFFSTALVCHGELARDRPSPKHLTEFYLWMSVGGMLGGMFNGLVAPLIFTGVIEFPLAIVLGCLLRPTQKGDGWTEDTLTNLFPNLAPAARERGDELAKSYNRTPPHSTYLLNYALDILLPLLLGLFVLTLVYFANGSWGWNLRPQYNPLYKFWRALGVGEQTAVSWASMTYNGLVNGLPMILCFLYFARPIRLGLGVGAVLLAQLGFQAYHEETTVYADRSYFGVLRVRETVERFESGDRRYYTSLMHGTTHHGLNYQYPEKYRRMATTYYHQYGPAGIVMNQYNWFKDGFRGKDVNEWAADMLLHTSDARMPASMVGLATAELGGVGIPLVSMVGLWSEPPYATIGLGTGTMASYGRPFQHVHYYEIDNKIRRLNLPEDIKKSESLWDAANKAQAEFLQAEKAAEDDLKDEAKVAAYKTAEAAFRAARQAAENYHPFNYLTDAKKRGAEVQVRMGDARLRMAFPYEPFSEKEEVEGVAKGGGPDSFYHMMVVDAFSSDAIPVHLITKEAIEMYFKKLTPEGILCVHTSNRHVDLVPVVEAVARSIKDYSPDGLACRRGHDSSPYGFPGHFTSEWVMVARSEDILNARLIPGMPPAKNELGSENSALTKIGLFTPPRYADAIRAKYQTERDVEYWEKPKRLLPYPWTDDYSNVLSVFRW